jgi:hypothetical protein
MERNCVWKVTGYCIYEASENIFEAYFTDKDKAEAVYQKGEREYGEDAGYTDMRWQLEGFYLANDKQIDQMFNDVKESEVM